jgi:hypothetical protein
MPRRRPLAAAGASCALVFLLLLLPHGARATGGGLAGDACDIDSDCMSRTCAADNTCTATTCGLSVANGGLGSSMPSGLCSATQFYNPSRICTFGYGKCAKAECCDTLACSVGVDSVSQASYCPSGKTFAPTRLCPGGVCSAAECCIQTRCDSAGGIAVASRSTFCPSGTMFNNAGICPAGEGKCVADDCCVPDTRTCEAAYADADTVARYGLSSCISPAVLVPTRLFDATIAGQGGCCETHTCGTTVADPGSFCASTPSPTVFNTSPACASGTCTTSDCCRSARGYCDGSATLELDGTCTCPAGKSYLIGTGCVCSPGTQLVNGSCVACPYGTYSGAATASQTCASCPASQPYTASTGADSADRCENWCDQSLLSGTSACSNAGVCTSLSGDPNAGGSFSCACPAAWMGYGATVTDNCDAPSTLLRLRVLAASGVTLPGNFQLDVTEAPAAAGDPPYTRIVAANSLACSLVGNPTAPTVPTCTTGGDGALSAALAADPTDTRNFVQAKVRLFTNYGSDASYVITWACSDGASSSTADLDVVLPGPANTNGAMALVCTAIVSRPPMATPIKISLAAGSLLPVAADASSGPALLTFTQGQRSACLLPMPSALSDPPAPPACAANEQPFDGGQPGTLGVANVDMEKYTLAWACAGSPIATTWAGAAETPGLPGAGEAVLACTAAFALKRPQLVLSVINTANVNIKLSALQPRMNEACVAPINNGANAQDAVLSCPLSALASGVPTTLTTNADPTSYLVTYDCITSTGVSASFAGSAVVNTTRNGDANPTACIVRVAPLPALLQLQIDNTANAPTFEAFASQEGSNTCVASSGGPSVGCFLRDGMSPGVATLLSPRALDADKYALTWSCTGTTAANVLSQASNSNSATVVLNANPNAGGAPVVCVGTVTARAAPVTVVFDGPLATLQLLPAGAELRVRQSHQSAVCTADQALSAVAPTCANEGLKSAVGRRTTLSTGGLPLGTTRVAWSCSVAGAPASVTLVGAGVAWVAMAGPGATVACKATLTQKPSPLSLEMAVPTGTPPAAAWTLAARQSNQGRACTVAVAASAASLAPATPTCPGAQPLLPQRATALTVPGLDASRWAVDWACVRVGGPNAGQALALANTVAASGAVVPNSKTATLDRDANAGGWPVACKATVSARSDVLKLAATGALPSSTGWTLTARQPTQSSACSVSGVANGPLAAAAPSCPSGVGALAPGAPAKLGVTGLPASSRWVWTCALADNTPVTVSLASTAAATVTPSDGAVTTCTLEVTAAAVDFFQIVGDTGLTLKASQDVNNTALCASSTAGTPAACPGAAPSTTTTLTAELDPSALPNTIVRFSCSLGVSGASVPVVKTSGFSAVVVSPPAVENLICAGKIERKPPILTISSNVPTVLTATAQNGANCNSSVPATKLVCDAGSSNGELPANVRVSLAQIGFSAAGYYRWACTRSDAGIMRYGNWTSPTASATVQLPVDGGKPVACWLKFTVDKPDLLINRRRRRRLLSFFKL